jgi:hypothetical protein
MGRRLLALVYKSLSDRQGFPGLGLRNRFLEAGLAQSRVSEPTFAGVQCKQLKSSTMSPLPIVYGTTGRVEPLLDPAILPTRFADLPQSGAPPPTATTGSDAVGSPLRWGPCCRQSRRGVRLARRHHAGSAGQDEGPRLDPQERRGLAQVELRRLIHGSGPRCVSLSRIVPLRPSGRRP